MANGTAEANNEDAKIDCKDVIIPKQPVKVVAKNPTATVDVAMEGVQEGEDDDYEGLEFIDPVAMNKAKIAEAAANKDDNLKPAMVKINGKLVPASTVSLNANANQSMSAGQ